MKAFSLSMKRKGCIAFIPLAQGLLTDKYLKGIPEDSRAAKQYIPSLNKNDVSPEVVNKVQKLNEVAKNRGQSLAQMALVWVLQEKSVVSALIGASKVSQIEDNVQALKNPDFTPEEKNIIEEIVK